MAGASNSGFTVVVLSLITVGATALPCVLAHVGMRRIQSSRQLRSHELLPKWHTIIRKEWKVLNQLLLPFLWLFMEAVCLIFRITLTKITTRLILNLMISAQHILLMFPVKAVYLRLLQHSLSQRILKTLFVTPSPLAETATQLRLLPAALQRHIMEFRVISVSTRLHFWMSIS